MIETGDDRSVRLGRDEPTAIGQGPDVVHGQAGVTADCVDTGAIWKPGHRLIG